MNDTLQMTILLRALLDLLNSQCLRMNESFSTNKISPFTSSSYSIYSTGGSALPPFRLLITGRRHRLKTPLACLYTQECYIALAFVSRRQNRTWESKLRDVVILERGTFCRDRVEVWVAASFLASVTKNHRFLILVSNSGQWCLLVLRDRYATRVDVAQLK